MDLIFFITPCIGVWVRPEDIFGYSLCHLWRLRDDLQVSVLSFHRGGPRGQTQVGPWD